MGGGGWGRLSLPRLSSQKYPYLEHLGTILARLETSRAKICNIETFDFPPKLLKSWKSWGNSEALSQSLLPPKQTNQPFFFSICKSFGLFGNFECFFLRLSQSLARISNFSFFSRNSRSEYHISLSTLEIRDQNFTFLFLLSRFEIKISNFSF